MLDIIIINKVMDIFSFLEVPVKEAKLKWVKSEKWKINHSSGGYPADKQRVLPLGLLKNASIDPTSSAESWVPHLQVFLTCIKHDMMNQHDKSS